MTSQDSIKLPSTFEKYKREFLNFFYVCSQAKVWNCSLKLLIVPMKWTAYGKVKIGGDVETVSVSGESG